MNNKKLLAYTLSISILFSTLANTNQSIKKTTPNRPFNVEEYIKEEDKKRQLKNITKF